MRKSILKFPRHFTRLMGQRKIVVENVLLHVKPISGPKSLSFTINLFVYFLAFSSLFFTPIWMISEFDYICSQSKKRSVRSREAYKIQLLSLY